MASTGSGYNPLLASCIHGNEFSGSIRLHSSDFLDQVNDNQLFNSYFVLHCPSPRACIELYLNENLIVTVYPKYVPYKEN
jgi:hypothetical protein